MSTSSHVTGVGTRTGVGGRSEGEDSFRVELASWRGRHLLWSAVGTALSVLLFWRLEGNGKILALAVLALFAGSIRALVRSLLHRPGEVALRGDEVILPLGLSTGRSITLRIGEVRHAYLLRRALGWTTTGPLLVIETARGVFELPRDWFTSESDQRKIARALNARLGRTG